jgi:hypothetical protein
MGKSLRYAVTINTFSKSEERLNQKEKFIEAARMLGCEENEPAFDEVVKKVAKPQSPSQDAEKPKIAG